MGFEDGSFACTVPAVRRPTILASLLVLALSLGACGGGDDDDQSTAEGPTKQQDVAAIEEALVTYGATEGGEVCDYYAESQLAAAGGLGECVQANQDTSSALFTVESVVVKGDEATAVVTVKGQEDEVSTYGLTREGGDWKISDFPSDDGLGGGGSDEAEPEPEPEVEETSLPDPEASARADVEELLADFGEAEGSEVCTFFSDELIEERGGLKSCQQYFQGKPALRSEIVKLSVTVPIYKEDVVPGASAVIKSGVSGQNLSLQLNVGGSVSDAYGGWIITSQSG